MVVHPPEIRLRAQELYVSGKAGLAEISRRLDVNYYSVKFWATKGAWREARDNLAQKKALAISQGSPVPDSAASLPPATATLAPTMQRFSSAEYQLERVSQRMEECTGPKSLDDLLKLGKLRGMIVSQMEIEHRVRASDATGNGSDLGSSRPNPPPKGAIVQPIRKVDAPQDVVSAPEPDEPDQVEE
jgi:transposase-like protein